MKNFKLTRKELYNLIWAEPLTSLAKKFETTDTALRKTCKDFNIPLPKSGHWMKVQFGKPVIKEPFEEKYSGPNEVSFAETNDAKTIVSIPNGVSPLDALKKEIEHDKNVSLIVPERLTKPDKLIESLKEVLENKSAYWSQGDRVKVWDHLNVLVTKANISRALRFMDTFIKALKSRGHEIEIRNNNTYVLIYSENIKISCKEKAKRIIVNNNTYNNTALRPTGILSFSIDEYKSKEWKDGKLKLEEQLSMILAKLETEAKRMQIERTEREKRNAEAERKRKIIEDIQKAKEKQLDDFKTLIKNSKRLKEVVLLREYINAVEIKAKDSGRITVELQHWIDWAQKKTDWYDPLLNSPDIDFEEVDKETLDFKKSRMWY